MTAKLIVEMDSAAFDSETAGFELARVLRQAAVDVDGEPVGELSEWTSYYRDSNGNNVASLVIRGSRRGQ